jgi:predicted secreted acid phosphatase
MKYLAKIVPHLFLTLNLIFMATASFSEPQNMGLLKKEIKYYHDSGLYEKELEQKIAEAQQYILEQAQLHQRKNETKLAIVLDIDETSLSNYDHIIERDFAGNHQQIHDVMLMANARVIDPMLRLYNTALKHGIKVFFVTGRKPSERQATEKNLIQAGYTNWSGLYVRPESYSPKSIIPFKSSTRAMIEKQGYIIIATIGDQCSDLKGGHAQKGFKLPNPFYYVS